MDCNIRTWNSLNGNAIHLIVGHTWSVNSLVILQNLDELISCSDDSTIKIWNTENENCVKTLISHANALKSIRITQKNKLISCSFLHILIRNPFS